MSIRATALKAGAELQLTKDAFESQGSDYMAQILDADSPEVAWDGILKMRALAQVIADLNGHIDTDKIQTKIEDEKNG
jgi:hypothetical protein